MSSTTTANANTIEKRCRCFFSVNRHIGFPFLLCWKTTPFVPVSAMQQKYRHTYYYFSLASSFRSYLTYPSCLLASRRSSIVDLARSRSSTIDPDISIHADVTRGSEGRTGRRRQVREAANRRSNSRSNCVRSVTPVVAYHEEG